VVGVKGETRRGRYVL